MSTTGRQFAASQSRSGPAEKWEMYIEYKLKPQTKQNKWLKTNKIPLINVSTL